MGRAPEWRHDALTGRQVLIAPERAERPQLAGPACPFCAGHEAETPPEVLAYRATGSKPNDSDWRVRVVPNRYAAVRLDAGTTTASDASPGVGIAEVFLECPQHETRFRNLPQPHVADVVRSWCARMRHWRNDGRMAFAQFFKNEGRLAGASVDHCHSQLIAVPFVPGPIMEEMSRTECIGECRLCHWLRENRSAHLQICRSGHFAVCCPPAPRTPGEIWIVPFRHGADFDAIHADELNDLAGVLLDALGRLHAVFDDPAFNLIVKCAPFRPAAEFHWRIEILPRTISTAGFEWGTGLLINTMFPERAAELLRDSRSAARG